MRTVLVIGASGRIAGCVVRRLAREDTVALRLLYRTHPTHASQTQAPPAGSQVLVGDYNDPACLAQALQGVQAAFLYAPDAVDAAPLRAARRGGLDHVVLLSSASVLTLTPGPNPIAERHRRAEAAVREAGVDCTFIRPGTLASNCLQWQDSIVREHAVHVPFPGSMRAPIHEDDIALLAVRALARSMHRGEALHVTGPHVVSIAAQVAEISRQLGAELLCLPIDRAAAMQAMTAGSRAMPTQAAERLLDYLEQSTTVRPAVTADFERATGGAARNFGHWVHDNLDHFRQPENRAS